jgi:hypothetical protein
MGTDRLWVRIVHRWVRMAAWRAGVVFVFAVAAGGSPGAGPGQAEALQADADLALELIASGVTTPPVDTLIAVLAAIRGGASTNAAAKASGINYRTAQRIVQADNSSSASG